MKDQLIMSCGEVQETRINYLIGSAASSENNCMFCMSCMKISYTTARDFVFSFGYGAPGVKTLPFYGKEKQPVTCNAKDIRMTQIIRPDGKALLLIGNMGGAVKADFELSGLGYGKCKITDIFTGKTLETPSLEIPRHGYALIQIEKQK